MNAGSRADGAEQAIEDAMMALTRAICLLGVGEGKEIVQHAHGVVAQSRRRLHEHGLITPCVAVTCPGTEAGQVSSPGAERVLAVPDRGRELRR